MLYRKFVREKKEKKKKQKRGDLSAVQCHKTATHTDITAWGCQLNKKQLILQHETTQMHKG